jgi:protein phosphatase
MKGKNNEDRYAVSTHRFGPQKNIPSVLALVCDGIGGHRAGEVAAEIAVESISQLVSQSNGDQPLEVLRQAIQNASAAVLTQAEANPERKGMGATCVCAWIIGDRLFTAYVGDSRLYLVRADQIQQLTTDHTWVQEAIEYGALTPEQGRNHPNAHVIRRYLGSKTNSEADFRMRLHPEDTDEQALANQGTIIQPGDFLVLCSDGLTDLVEKEEILSALKSQSREAALQTLTDLANERGGHDNITMVVLEAPPTFGPEAPAEELPAVSRFTPRKLALPCLIIAIVLGILGAAGAGAVWYLNRETPTPTPTLSPEASSTTQPILAPTQTLTQTTPTATVQVSPTQTGMNINQAGPQGATYTPWPTNTRPPATPTATETPTTLPTSSATPQN